MLKEMLVGIGKQIIIETEREVRAAKQVYLGEVVSNKGNHIGVAIGHYLLCVSAAQEAGKAFAQSTFEVAERLKKSPEMFSLRDEIRSLESMISKDLGYSPKSRPRPRPKAKKAPKKS